MARLIRRWLVVLLTFFLAAPAGADDKLPVKPADKPPVKPGEARRTALVQAGYTLVPLTLKPGQLPPGVPPVPIAESLGLYVDGAVGPEKVRFLLDSGAETMLDLKLAKRLKLELGAEVPSAGVGGRSAGRPTIVPGLMIGPYDTRKDWPKVAVEAEDLSVWPGVPGVLGIDVFDAWGAVVDFPARALYLRSPLTTAWPRLAGTWTVTSWQEDGAARKLDPKAPPMFEFADRRLKLTDGGQTREFSIRMVSADDGVNMVDLFDPKQEGKPDPVTLADGLVKVKDGAMTACLALDVKKAKESPAEFAAPKGSGYVLLELKRTGPDAQKPPADPLHELLLKDGYTAVQMDREPDGKRIVTARVGRHDLRLVVDTGAVVSAFDTAGLGKWGAERLGKMETLGFGGKAMGEKIILRGLKLGGYDTRRAWMEVAGHGYDLAELNKLLVEQKRQPIQGVLGNIDLLTGSAVIDFGTNTLYLRPAKETVGPLLEGKWVGVRYESEGKKGRYAPGETAVEFKAGRARFTTLAGTTETGFHLQDLGDRYRVGGFVLGTDELADEFMYPSGVVLLRLDGGTLTLVIGQGLVRKEPTEFAAPKGSGLLLIEYERAK